MKKLTKNMRITHSIIMVVILATAFLAIVGGIGYKGIGSINNNVSQIYNEAVLKTQLATEINQKFMNIRIEVLRVMDLGYNPSIIKNIDNLDQELRDLMDVYLEGQDEESRENTVLESAKSNYDIFVASWADVVKKLQRYEELDDQDKLSLESRGNAILNNLVYVIKNNKEFAEELYDESMGIYNANIRGLSTISIIALITLLGFSFLIIGILKKSIKEMNGIFENVATG
ncbi:Four helix bundle sensory module for signal transduction, partial [Anaerovirgula multivorans]